MQQQRQCYNGLIVCVASLAISLPYLRALALAQRDLLKLLGKSELICKFEEVSHGVCPWRQHKDERRDVAGVLESACQVEGRWFCKSTAKMLCHKALYCWRYLKSIALLAVGHEAPSSYGAGWLSKTTPKHTKACLSCLSTCLAATVCKAQQRLHPNIPRLA